MKALSLKAIGQLELVDLPTPVIGPDELLIHTGATTICTSDVNDLRENPFGIRLPVVIGHEGAGSVAAVGSQVHQFKIGQRVATHPVHPCGNCPPCRDGLGHLCLNMGHFGINLPGTMAEYYRVRQDRARPIDDVITFPVAALVEPVCVCLEALAQARLHTGSSLLILGDGPFGILMSRLAARLALGRVVLAGQIDFRLAFVRSTVRMNTYNSPDPVKMMLGANQSGGYDAVILAVGSRQALADGLQCLKPRGRMVVFSALPGKTPVDLFQVHLKELEILGACSDRDMFDEACTLLKDRSLGLDELVTHRFRLEDYRPAFELAEHGKDRALKVAFVL
jgi:threonine dehydrogenase-like Zn-dependent dehydrogenase